MTGLTWLALTGAAGAAVTVTLTPGPLDPLYFEPEAVGLNHFTLGGIAWTDVSGAADTERGSVAGVYAAPEGMGASTTTGTTYMAVEGGGTEMATFATPQTSLSLYWGSIDGNGGNLNSISPSRNICKGSLRGGPLFLRKGFHEFKQSATRAGPERRSPIRIPA